MDYIKRTAIKCLKSPIDFSHQIPETTASSKANNGAVSAAEDLLTSNAALLESETLNLVKPKNQGKKESEEAHRRAIYLRSALEFVNFAFAQCNAQERASSDLCGYLTHVSFIEDNGIEMVD